MRAPQHLPGADARISRPDRRGTRVRIARGRCDRLPGSCTAWVCEGDGARLEVVDMLHRLDRIPDATFGSDPDGAGEGARNATVRPRSWRWAVAFQGAIDLALAAGLIFAVADGRGAAGAAREAAEAVARLDDRAERLERLIADVAAAAAENDARYESLLKADVAMLRQDVRESRQLAADLAKSLAGQGSATAALRRMLTGVVARIDNLDARLTALEEEPRQDTGRIFVPAFPGAPPDGADRRPAGQRGGR
jgi:hypothetical protein